jgi:glutamyl-tRNA synthetase
MTSPAPRVRFAPSPTGFLHVGGARTALFNWLFARHHKGAFILRIEDTDRERSSDEMSAAILDGMRWLGLGWDEGPFHQADGLLRHQEDARALLARGAAYRCFCTAQELEQKRAAAGDSYRYDRKCLREVTLEESDARARAGEPHTLRFRVPKGTTSWEDAVHGRLEIPNSGMDDFIVLRTDGTPIYNLAVVSDDIAMRITHVIRGDDHISNTPKQIMIYRALDAALPVFAHVPMILGQDGKRLSKRHGATAVGEYQGQGILPAALRNFLALLGWSPGDDREIMTVTEMVERFALESINKKSAIFDSQKLLWMNGQYVNELPVAELVSLVIAELARDDGAGAERLRKNERLPRAVELLRSRARTVTELGAQVRPYIEDPVSYDPDAVKKHWQDSAAAKERLAVLRARFGTLTGWRKEELEATLREVAEKFDVAAASVIHPLRVALTGSAVSPGIFDVLAVLGREVSLRRIDSAIVQLT